MLYNVSDQIKDFYDKESINKIRDYVYGNARVNMAWETIEAHVINPFNILEIGCGIGAMCSRLSLRWPETDIIGIDISERSIEIAQTLFETSKSKFYTSLPEDLENKKKFDLILLIDVLEHVELEKRDELVSFIKRNLKDDGMLLLAFPTPHMLNINRNYFPEKLQPVEEDIFISDLQKISNVLHKPLVLYKEIFIWEKRDYAHAILANELRISNKKPDPFKKVLKNRIQSKLKRFSKRKELSLIEIRKDIVVQKLGADYNQI